MGRSPCCDKNGLKKGPWTSEEDLKLINYIQLHAPGNWRTLPKKAGLQRCGKSCRLRWTNYLRPDIKRGRFSFEEEETIIQLHSVLGNKWSAIAAKLPGRTDNEIKNYWNTHIRKRLLRNGIDPITHAPRLDLLHLSTILRSTLCNPNPQFLTLSNLLRTQALFNPQLLNIASSLLSLKQENPEMLLQFLQQNQLFSNSDEIQKLVEMQQQNQFQIPPFGQDVSYQSEMVQAKVDNEAFGFQHSQQEINPIVSSDFVSQPNYPPCTTNSNPSSFPGLSESSSFQSLSIIDENNLMSFEALMSASPTQLNSSSTFINSSSTEDERESHCSSWLNFEIPECLDINDFL